jgi:hypothetical protein
MQHSHLLMPIRFLPETTNTRWNGSIYLSALYSPLVPIVGRGNHTSSQDGTEGTRRRFANPFLLFMYPDVTITLIFTGIVYAVNYTITATISLSFADAYPYLTETDLGLCYLSTGGGMIVGSTLTGQLLDHEYHVVKDNIMREHQNDLEGTKFNFPIEIARLRTMPIHLGVFTACIIAWGWCLEKKVSIAAPLVLQILCKFVLCSVRVHC